MSARAFALVALAVMLAAPASELSHAQTIGPAGGPWGAPYRGDRGAAPPGPYAPYEAPPARGGGSQLDGDAAAAMLRGRGFSNISVIRRRGATILLEANGPRGERVQVVVDSASGAISGMKVIGFGDKRY